MEKILAAFESSAQTSSRLGEGSDEDDDEKLPKKINDLLEIVKKLRTEIGEYRAGQTSIEVNKKYLKYFQLLNCKIIDIKQKSRCASGRACERSHQTS